jgi:hypothetical protein
VVMNEMHCQKFVMLHRTRGFILSPSHTSL